MEDIKKKDEAYMRRALIEAQAAFDEDEIPVGAIIVCKDRIISRAHNLTEMLTDVTAHGDASHHIGCQYAGWEISEGLHALCHRRTLRHVRRSFGMGTD